MQGPTLESLLEVSDNFLSKRGFLAGTGISPPTQLWEGCWGWDASGSCHNVHKLNKSSSVREKRKTWMHEWWWMAPGRNQPSGSPLEMAVLHFSSPRSERLCIFRKEISVGYWSFGCQEHSRWKFLQPGYNESEMRVCGRELICMPPQEKSF